MAAAAKSWSAPTRNVRLASRSWRWIGARAWPTSTACLRDGYSTGGTSGNGLGAIKRLAPPDAVPLRAAEAAPPCWCAWAGQARQRRRATLDTPPSLCVPKTGETVCGDTAAIVTRTGRHCRRAAGGRAWPRSTGRRCLRRSRAAVPQAPRHGARPRRWPPCTPDCAQRAVRRWRSPSIDPGGKAGHLQRHRQHRRVHHRYRAACAAWCRTAAPPVTPPDGCRTFDIRFTTSLFL